MPAAELGVLVVAGCGVLAWLVVRSLLQARAEVAAVAEEVRRRREQASEIELFLAGRAKITDAANATVDVVSTTAGAVAGGIATVADRVAAVFSKRPSGPSELGNPN